MSLIIYGALFMLSLGINFLVFKFWNRKKIDFLRSIVKSDRWGAQRIPLTGGIVIVGLFLLGFLFIRSRFTVPIELIAALIGCVLMFVLGLVDDLFDLKSYQKLVAQIVIIMFVMSLGVRAALINNTILDFGITFFWILVLTNSFNLLDNMDGLAGGIALIAFTFLGIHFLQYGNQVYSIFCFLLVSAIMGFLVFNFNPAKIYLGDSGALFIGFFLSTLTVLGTRSSGRSLFGIMIFPIILMAIPIFDTLLVSITRKTRGQSPLQGGRDHLSHRLVMIGMTERQAVLFLYGISILLGVSALMLQDLSIFTSVTIYFFVSVLIVLFGLFIGKIKIASGNEQKESTKAFVLQAGILYKYNILQILIDIVLLGACYYFAYVIRFGAEVETYHLGLFLQSLPFIILIKILLLFFFGAYKTNDGYFGFSDVTKIVKSMAIGSAVMVVILTFWFRFERFSRAVFLIDWMLSMIVIGGVRFFYRFFEELFYPFREKRITGITFIGDRDTYRALQGFLRVKEGLDYRIRLFVPGGTFKPSELEKREVGVLVIEDKYGEALKSSEPGTKSEMKVYSLTEFLTQNLGDNK